jgi:GT2 family glycosyltransferase
VAHALSVLVVSFNTRDLLGACLRSLPAGLRRHGYEVIVADNGSNDGSVAMLRRDWPSVTVLELGANLGFARATNRALAHARGRHALLLNSDAEIQPEALDRLVDFLDATPSAGVAAPRLLNTDLSDQGTARAFPTPAVVLFGRRSPLTRLFPRNRWSRRYLVGRDRAGDRPFEVDWVSGACMMVRREAVAAAGPLDEGFFMYWEDADWCRRIKTSGYHVYCVPGARVIHHEGGSSGGRRARLVWTFHRSAYRYFAKHHAPQPWNPLRAVVGAGLTVRAALLAAVSVLRGHRPGRPA